MRLQDAKVGQKVLVIGGKHEGMTGEVTWVRSGPRLNKVSVLLDHPGQALLGPAILDPKHLTPAGAKRFGNRAPKQWPEWFWFAFDNRPRAYAEASMSEYWSYFDPSGGSENARRTQKAKREWQDYLAQRRFGNATAAGGYRVEQGPATPIGSWYVIAPDGKRFGPFTERGAHHEAQLYAKFHTRQTGLRTKPTRLITSENTSRAEKAVRSAATAKFGRGKKDVVYEHGQWWVIVWDPVEEEDVTYSAVDTSRGIDFERL